MRCDVYRAAGKVATNAGTKVFRPIATAVTK
jgi:hypothetical protein